MVLGKLDIHIQKSKIVKLLEENKRKILFHIGLGNNILGTTPRQSKKAKLNNWEFIKLKQQNEKQTRGMGENICKLYIHI